MHLVPFWKGQVISPAASAITWLSGWVSLHPHHPVRVGPSPSSLLSTADRLLAKQLVLSITLKRASAGSWWQPSHSAFNELGQQLQVVMKSRKGGECEQNEAYTFSLAAVLQGISRRLPVTDKEGRQGVGGEYWEPWRMRNELRAGVPRHLYSNHDGPMDF